MEEQHEQRALIDAYPDVADDPDEKLVSVVRKHWIGLLGIYITAGIVMLVLLGLGVALPSLTKAGGVNVPANVMGLLVLFLLLIVFFVVVGTAVAAWVYNQSRILITNENVIEIKQSSLFSRKVSHLNMINVEDVSVVKNGILQTFLDYGTLNIQTAGEMENFNFVNTPHPNEYRRYIIEAHEAAIENVGQMGAVQRVEISHNNL